MEMNNLLEAIGYSPNNDSPYVVMGIAELDGPELTEHLLTRRSQFADRLLKHFTTTTLQDACDKLIHSTKTTTKYIDDF